jgi:hypothetical protein
VDIGLTLGRFFAGAIFTALIAIGGVWAVVQISVSGMQTAVETTNKRIDDLSGRLGEIKTGIDKVGEVVAEIDKRLAVIETKVDSGFRDTQSEIKKRADVIPQGIDLSPTRIAIARIGRQIEEKVQLEALLASKPRVVFLPTEAAWDRFATSVEPNNVIPLATLDSQTVSDAVKAITVDGLSTEQFINAVRSDPEGATFLSESGKAIIGKLENGRVTVSTDEGHSAVVQGVGSVGVDSGVIRVDKVFKLPKLF